MESVPAHKEDTLELVREKLREYLLAEKNERLHSIDVFRVLKKPFSIATFLSVQTDRGCHRFVAKRHIHHPVNAGIVSDLDQANVEFNILRRLYKRYAEVEHCAVPRPVAVIPEVDSFVMEFVDGRLLQDDLKFVHYFENRTRFKALQSHFYHCGRWLRSFQEFTGYRRAGPDAVRHILIRCEDRLKMIEASGDRRCPRDLRGRVTDLLHSHVQALSTDEILVSGRHGDFGPWNIMVDLNGVTVIDFYGFQDGPVPVDVLKILVFLETMSCAIPNSPSRVQSLREQFLSGLGPMPELPHSLLVLCEAMHRIVVVAGITTAPSLPLFRQFEKSVILRNNLQWLLKSASRTPTLLPMGLS